MASKGQASKATAIAAAKALGLKVAERSEGSGRERYVRIEVGSSLVEYRGSWGGKACYHCDGELVGYVGEAIERAALKQRGGALKPTTFGGGEL